MYTGSSPAPARVQANSVPWSGGRWSHRAFDRPRRVVSVATLLLDGVVSGVVTFALIQTLLPKVVTRAMVEGGSKVFPALGASLLALEKQDMLGGEKELLTANMADLASAVWVSSFGTSCDGFVRSTHAMIMGKEIKTDQLCPLRRVCACGEVRKRTSIMMSIHHAGVLVLERDVFRPCIFRLGLA
jgi:hypothetical protein